MANGEYVGTIWGFIPVRLAPDEQRDDKTTVKQQCRNDGGNDGGDGGAMMELQMIIGITLIHFGYHRSKKAATSHDKHRLAVIFFTLAAIAILTMIPWWRPLIRLF